MADKGEFQVIDKRRLNLSDKQVRKLEQERKKRDSPVDMSPGPQDGRSPGDKIHFVLQSVADNAVRAIMARQIAPLLDKIQVDMRNQFMMVAQGANYAQAVGLVLLKLLAERGVLSLSQFEEAVEAFESMTEHTQANVNAFLRGEPVPTKERRAEDAGGSEESGSRPEGGGPDSEGKANIRPAGGAGDDPGYSPQHQEDLVPEMRPGGDSDQPIDG